MPCPCTHGCPAVRSRWDLVAYVHASMTSRPRASGTPSLPSQPGRQSVRASSTRTETCAPRLPQQPPLTAPWAIADSSGIGFPHRPTLQLHPFRPCIFSPSLVRALLHFQALRVEYMNILGLVRGASPFGPLRDVPVSFSSTPLEAGSWHSVWPPAFSLNHLLPREALRAPDLQRGSSARFWCTRGAHFLERERLAVLARSFALGRLA